MQTSADIQTSVDLQDPFSYSKVPIYITLAALAALIVILIAIYFIRKYLKNKNKPKVVKEKPKVFKPRNKLEIRSDYLSRIAAIEKKYREKKIDVRMAHQELSAVVRLFVHEMTGIEAQNLSLMELKEQGVPISSLIEEFYAPEFAERTDKETMDSIKDARTVVETWN